MPNLAKRSLIAVVADISPSMDNIIGGKSAIELLNEKHEKMIAELLANPKLRTAAEICYVTYSTDVNVSSFVPLKTIERNVPVFKAEKKGGTRTAAAMKAAYDQIHKRAKELGGNLYTSIVILLTDGDVSVHDSAELIQEVTSEINACTLKESRVEKVLPIIVGLGDNIADSTKTILAGFSKGLIDKGFFQIHNGSENDVDNNLTKLFKFISQSIVKSTNVDSVDVLLKELRELIQEAYGETICPVNS